MNAFAKRMEGKYEVISVSKLGEVILYKNIISMQIGWWA